MKILFTVLSMLLVIFGLFGLMDESRGSTPVILDGWAAVHEWVVRLKEMRLIGLESGDVSGGFAGMYLTELGQMLVRVTMT
jgi:hypothetical protein